MLRSRIGRQFKTLVAPERRDVSRLARKIDFIFRIDFDLLSDFRGQFGEKRGQTFVRSEIVTFGYDSSSNAVRRCPSLLSESPKGSASFGVRDTDLANSRASFSIDDFVLCARARSPLTHPIVIPISVSR